MDKGNAFVWEPRVWLDCHRIACRTESSRTYVRSTFEFLRGFDDDQEKKEKIFDDVHGKKDF